MKHKIIAAAILLMSPLSAHAFTEAFKTDMANIQSDVMLKASKTVSKADMEKAWHRFDDEIIPLLNSKEKWSESELNDETKKIPLAITLRGNGEMEDIELGSVEVKFYDIEKGDAANPIWVAALINDMETVVANTFHVYTRPSVEKKKKPRKLKKDQQGIEDAESAARYELAAAFEDVTGPWQFSEADSLIGMNIQIQKLWERSKPGALQFATYHAPIVWKKKDLEEANRQQILWKLSDKKLQPLLWFPEVDWHMVEGRRVEGRAEGILPEQESEKNRKKR